MTKLDAIAGEKFGQAFFVIVCLIEMPLTDNLYEYDYKQKQQLSQHEQGAGEFLKGTVRPMEGQDLNGRRPRWWFGGVASTSVACVVAPMDLIKSHMQTQKRKKGIWSTARKVIKLRGYIGFYDGFSAAAFRQMFCTSLRFSIYEAGKDNEMMNNHFLAKMGLASFAGVMGAAVGIPTDVVNVRMQNDMKHPEEHRRNYKHVFDALKRIPKEEGYASLYSGASAAVMKSAMGTIGQIAVYDQIKTLLIKHFKMGDDMSVHFQASLLASIIGSIISQPFDVLKTLMMNARPGQYRNMADTVRYMLRFGPIGLFRGLLPTMARKGPATILLFMIYEQLRLNLGYLPLEKNE